MMREWDSRERDRGDKDDDSILEKVAAAGKPFVRLAG
jgi:hypothetical protein